VGLTSPSKSSESPQRKEFSHTRWCDLGCYGTGCTLEWQRLDGPPMPPTFANGKICYIEVPATDIARSSNFYKQVFG
jgi:hypothetical protein